MTDEQYARYIERIAPLREDYQRDLVALEQQAADGIARDLDGLRGIISSTPIEFIEGRWLRWLDASINHIAERYQRESTRIAEEVTQA